MKKCGNCKYWIVNTKIGYCTKNHLDNIDEDDLCDLYGKGWTEEEWRNAIENCPRPRAEEFDGSEVFNHLKKEKK